MGRQFLSNIGESLALRKLVSETDIDNKPIRLSLDHLRSLEVLSKTASPRELRVECRDTDDQAVTVVLHLPFYEGGCGSATINE